MNAATLAESQKFNTLKKADNIQVIPKNKVTGNKIWLGLEKPRYLYIVISNYFNSNS